MEFRNANINEKGYIYGKWMRKPGEWTITYGNVYCYLIEGTEKAALIDTAYGAGNLREFVEEMTDKPVMVINTHGHFDHTGGNPWWEEVWAGPGAEEVIKQAFSEEDQKAFNAKPHPDYKVNTVREGDVIDLGGRQLEIIQIPAHHKSSIAILDRQGRALYTGDEMEAGQVLLFAREGGPSQREIFAQHLENMKKLKARMGEYDTVYPAHNGPQLDPKYIDDYIALDEGLLNGTAKVMPDTAGYGFSPTSGGSRWGNVERAQYGGASIVYVKES